MCSSEWQILTADLDGQSLEQVDDAGTKPTQNSRHAETPQESEEVLRLVPSPSPPVDPFCADELCSLDSEESITSETNQLGLGFESSNALRLSPSKSVPLFLQPGREHVKSASLMSFATSVSVKSTPVRQSTVDLLQFMQEEQDRAKEQALQDAAKISVGGASRG